MSPQYHVEVPSVSPRTVYQVVVTTDGLTTKPVGPRWSSPREASDYIRTLTSFPDVPPLRAAGQPGFAGAVELDPLPGSSDLPPFGSDDPTLGL